MWLRALFNSLVFPLWTALSVTAGLCAGWLTRDPLLFYRWQRGWARWLLRFCGIELEVRGAEHMTTDGPYVIVANHASYMDIPALFASLPKLPQFMAKSELARIPFLGAALRAGRHILVNRGNHGTARTSLDSAAEHLKSGAAILMFPEGTRSTADAIGRFKTARFAWPSSAKLPSCRLASREHATCYPSMGGSFAATAFRCTSRLPFRWPRYETPRSTS
jgi:1-acyl-sn-glycerol-3-phosphate acyltransferase